MTQSMTELTRTYARRVLDTLKDPAIRSQAQVVLRSPEMRTLTGMLTASLHGKPPSTDPGDAPVAASQPKPKVNPFQQPTQDFALSPTLVLDRAELDAQQHHGRSRSNREAPQPATPVPPDQHRGIPDWSCPGTARTELRRRSQAGSD